MANKFFFIFFLFGMVVIAFFAGAISKHYELSATSIVSEAIISAEAWLKLGEKQEDLMHSSQGKADKTAPTVFWNKNRALMGYTLIIEHLKKSVYLVDMKGRSAHKWRVDFNSIWPNPKHINNRRNQYINVRDAHVYPNGDLLALFSGENDTPYGYGFAKLNKDSRLIWKYSSNTHHDFYVDQTGSIYAMTHEIVKTPPKGAEKLPFPMLADYIVTLTPDGKETQKLSVLEAFLNSDYFFMIWHDNRENESWDYLHTNSIMKLEPHLAAKFPMFKPGQVMVSIRNPGVIAMIDLQLKKVIWATTGYWKMQHDVRFLPDGNLIMFDNQGHYSPKKDASRVLIIEPTTLKTVWYYAGGAKKHFYSDTRGGVQSLKNGNVLITSTKERNSFEVTPDHEVVWDYKIPASRAKQLLNAIRYTPEEVPFISTH